MSISVAKLNDPEQLFYGIHPVYNVTWGGGIAQWYSAGLWAG